MHWNYVAYKGNNIWQRFTTRNMYLTLYVCIQLCHWIDFLGKCINLTGQETRILVQRNHAHGSDDSDFSVRWWRNITCVIAHFVHFLCVLCACIYAGMSTHKWDTLVSSYMQRPKVYTRNYRPCSSPYSMRKSHLITHWALPCGLLLKQIILMTSYWHFPRL